MNLRTRTRRALHKQGVPTCSRTTGCSASPLIREMHISKYHKILSAARLAGIKKNTECWRGWEQLEQGDATGRAVSHTINGDSRHGFPKIKTCLPCGPAILLLGTCQREMRAYCSPEGGMWPGEASQHQADFVSEDG